MEDQHSARLRGRGLDSARQAHRTLFTLGAADRYAGVVLCDLTDAVFTGCERLVADDEIERDVCSQLLVARLRVGHNGWHEWEGNNRNQHGDGFQGLLFHLSPPRPLRGKWSRGTCDLFYQNGSG